MSKFFEKTFAAVVFGMAIGITLHLCGVPRETVSVLMFVAASWVATVV